MPPKDYTGNIVRFKANVILVQIEEKSLVINLARKQRFKGNNDAANMLLYLLMCDRGEEIDFNGLKTHVLNQYALTDAQATTELNTFLNKMEFTYNLIESLSGTANIVTDPLNLYPDRSNKLTWDPPDLLSGANQAKDTYMATTIYTNGYIKITYRP